MPFLRQSTIQTIRFGPFLDKTDGVTEEVALTITQALRRISKDGGAYAQSGETGNSTHDSDGWYSDDFTAADTGTVGELILNVQDPATHLPVWMRWWVLEEAVYDAMFGAAAAGPLQPTVAGRTLDVTAGGAAGLDWGNVENKTTANDLSATDIQLSDTATTLTNLPAITANWLTAAGINAGALDNKGNWNIGKTGFSLAATGIDAILKTATGMVAIASAVWDRVLTGATHNIASSAGRRLRIIQESGSYQGGAVWIDTVNGTAGTTDFENGVDILPVSTIADANTIAASVSLVRFQVAPASSITFPGAQTNEIWKGREWTLALASRDITGSFIFGAIVSGIATATASYKLEECDIGAVTLDNDGHFERCDISGVFTIGQAGTFTFHDCFTLSTNAVTIDFAALGATAVHLFGFDGEINFKNMAAGDTVHIIGGGTITTETCTAGTIDHDGFFEYTDAGGNVTEVQSDIKVAVDATLVDTTEIGTAGAGLTNINLPNQAMDITGDVTGNLSGSVGSVTGAVGSVTGAVGSVTATVTANIASTDDIDLSVTQKASVNTEVDAAFTTQMADSVPADGTIATREQAIYLIQQMLTEFAIAGTTMTVKKVDGTTTLITLTLDDATNPTSITRAT